MHLIDTAAGVMGSSAVVGTTIPQAVRYVWGVKLGGARTVVVSFFGDGALEKGVSHESMNFAALKKYPVIFVCENNFFMWGLAYIVQAATRALRLVVA